MENDNKKKKSKVGRIIKWSLLVILLLVVILFVTVIIIWRNELSTLMSLDKIVDANEDNKSGPVYEIEVDGDYYLDDFVEQGGVESDQELIDFIVDNLTKGIIPIELNAPTIGCSSFTAVTPEGDRLFGRNYDFSTTSAMIVKTNPGNGRYASISSVDLQFLGIEDGRYLDSLMDKLLCLAVPYIPLDGINEKGLACGIYMSYQGNEEEVYSTNQNTDKPDMTSTTMLRMFLDYAANVEEAVEIAKSYDLHDSASTSFHYMVADATGKSAILEWVPADGNSANDIDGSKRVLNVIYNDQDSNLGEKEANDKFQYVTNFINTPNYYSSDMSKGGFDRYNAIQAKINPDGTNNEGVLTKDQALEVLQLVGRRDWDAANGKTDSNTITVWSALYDLTNKKVIWVSNEEFENKSSIFELDFSYLN